MPKVRSPEDRAEDARITRALLAIADDVVSGRITAAEARERALAEPTLSPYARMPGNWLAAELQHALANIGQPYRLSDVLAHAASVRRGEMRVPGVILCHLSVPIDEISRTTGQQAFIFDFDGLGYHLGIEFGSPATGRAFSAYRPLDGPEGRPVTDVVSWGIPDDLGARAEVYQDLFDTLCVDDADCTVPLDVPLPRWDLMRVDDNGNEFVVASYTGFAKANAGRRSWSRTATSRPTGWFAASREAGPHRIGHLASRTPPDRTCRAIERIV